MASNPPPGTTEQQSASLQSRLGHRNLSSTLVSQKEKLCKEAGQEIENSGEGKANLG